MVWIALGGIVLQALGLWLAIRGITKTYRTLFPEGGLWRELRSECWRWFRSRVLNLKEHHKATATMNIKLSSDVVAHRRAADPGADAAVDKQVQYLRRSVEILYEELLVAEDKLGKEVARVEAEVRSVSSQADERDRMLRTALVGHDGRGLRETAAGLAITLVGVLLTIAGLPWG